MEHGAKGSKTRIPQLFFGLFVGMSGWAFLFLSLVKGSHQDFTVAYMPAAGRWLVGESLYGAQMVGAAFSPFYSGAFIYPPVSVLFWLPFIALPVSLAIVAYSFIQFAALLSALSYLARSLRARMPMMLFFVGLAALWPGVTSDLVNGNTGIVSAAAGFFAISCSKRTLRSSLLIMLAIAIKPAAFPIAIALIGLWLGQGRGIALRGICCLLALAVIGALIGFIVSPSDSLAFPRVFQNLTAGGVSLVSDHIRHYDLSATNLLEQLGVSRSTGRPFSLALAGAFMLWSLLLGKRGQAISALGAAVLATLCLGATVWLHYTVPVVFLVVFLVLAKGGIWRSVGLVAYGIVVACPFIMPLETNVDSPLLWISLVGPLIAVMTVATARLEPRLPAVGQVQPASDLA